MQGAEVLTKFTADSSQMDNATKNLQENLKQTKKQGELAFLGLTTAVDAFVGAIVTQNCFVGKSYASKADDEKSALLKRNQYPTAWA